MKSRRLPVANFLKQNNNKADKLTIVVVLKRHHLLESPGAGDVAE
jgi:hypothetical protein